MGLSATLKNTAESLINTFGNTLVLSSIVEGAYDPLTGAPAQTITTITTKGIDEDYISEHSQAGDMRITFVSSTVIDAYDRATYKGKDREIKSIKQLNMTDETIIYEIIVTGDARVQAL